MAEKGTGASEVREKVEKALQGMMQDSRRAITEKNLDPVFFTASPGFSWSPN